MLDSLFNSGSLETSKTALEAAWKTHSEAAHNLNNADTPGYKAQQTDFKSLLLNLQDAQGPEKGEAFEAYLSEVQPKLEEVNVDRELARLSQASMDADALTKILNQQYSRLRAAIYEGKR
jgi:flagellar basal body rod protein FlgB